MTILPATRFGPYEVLDLLGAGGMGEVYRARDTRLDRMVALKILPDDLAADPARTTRFLQEARTISTFAHPNIAQLYDLGDEDGRTYLVMELVDGTSLERLIESAPLPLLRIVRIGTAIADALEEAHRRGITHRDVKPANVMITSSGVVKVLDFGLAKRDELATTSSSTAIRATTPGTLLGTVQYMSPEQARGREVDHRSDIFSTGIVLYQMSTGQLPFFGTSTYDILDRIVHADPLNVSNLNPALPRSLDGVIRRCLAKEPQARFATAADLAAALGEVEAGMARESESRPSLLVLPFTDISPAEATDYFSVGLTEEITATLSKIGSLAVISRTTAMKVKSSSSDVRTLGREMNVAYILEGSVRKAGNALRIVANLIDTTSDTHVWAETYRGTLDDIFDIQEKVATSIAESLTDQLTLRDRVALTRRDTDRPEAYDHCLRGRYLLTTGTRKNVREALELFTAAITIDGRYAAAYAGVAEASAFYYEMFDRDDTLLSKAIENGLKALMYDSDLAEAYAALASAYFNRGNLEDALTACTRAIEVDPDNFIGYFILGRIHHLSGRKAEALEMLVRAISLKSDYYPAYFMVRMVSAAMGEPWRYEPLLHKLVEEVFPEYLAMHPDDARALNSFGMELAHAGRVEESRIYIRKALDLARDDPALCVATACYEALFGDRRSALDLLHRAVASGYANATYLRMDPDLESLHSEPDFQTLISQLEKSE